MDTFMKVSPAQAGRRNGFKYARRRVGYNWTQVRHMKVIRVQRDRETNLIIILRLCQCQYANVFLHPKIRFIYVSYICNNVSREKRQQTGSLSSFTTISCHVSAASAQPVDVTSLTVCDRNQIADKHTVT